MQKEILSLENILRDLRLVSMNWMVGRGDWRLVYIIPTVSFAVLFWIFLKTIWISLAILVFSAYHIYRYAMEYREYRAQKKALDQAFDRGNISISVERLNHVCRERIYEPHYHKRNPFGDGNVSLSKNITLYCFLSGGRWRVPDVDKHYAWSENYYVSTNGLENVSIPGDEFFFITLQGYHELSYIYPCKFFTLDKELETRI